MVDKAKEAGPEEVEAVDVEDTEAIDEAEVDVEVKFEFEVEFRQITGMARRKIEPMPTCEWQVSEPRDCSAQARDR